MDKLQTFDLIWSDYTVLSYPLSHLIIVMTTYIRIRTYICMWIAFNAKYYKKNDELIILWSKMYFLLKYFINSAITYIIFRYRLFKILVLSFQKAKYYSKKKKNNQ